MQNLLGSGSPLICGSVFADFSVESDLQKNLHQYFLSKCQNYNGPSLIMGPAKYQKRLGQALKPNSINLDAIKHLWDMVFKQSQSMEATPWNLQNLKWSSANILLSNTMAHSTAQYSTRLYSKVHSLMELWYLNGNKITVRRVAIM